MLHGQVVGAGGAAVKYIYLIQQPDEAESGDAGFDVFKTLEAFTHKESANKACEAWAAKNKGVAHIVVQCPVDRIGDAAPETCIEIKRIYPK